MALQSAQAEQQLLYSLRNPTAPLPDKLAQATSALDASPSSLSLPPLVRDWALETLLKGTRTGGTDSLFLNADLWRVVARTTEATSSASTSTPTLPIFVSFVAAYAEAQSQSNVEVLRSALAAWRRLAPGALRKATPDAALDGYERLVDATVKVLQRDGEGQGEAWRLWEEFAIVWLKALRGVVLDGGKGGKKVPQHTLGLLPKLLPLLALLEPTTPLHLTLLQTVQLAVFNLENLRRGLARETYTAVSSQGAAATADIELLAALSPLLSTLSSPIHAVLPALTSLYLSSLAVHSAVLFPLPAKANFPTPSAQKSALEVLGLSKRRELAGRWVKGVAELLSWSTSGEAMAVDAPVALSATAATAVAAVLAEVEKEDLYRSGQAGEGWEGVLPAVVRGAVQRLQDSALATAEREAIVEVLSAVAKLSYEAVEPELASVLAVLAQSPSTSTSTAPATKQFLAQLVTHHSRSVSLPTFLSLLADALASTSTLPLASRPASNLLTAPSFLHTLGHALSGAVGSSTTARATYEALLAPVRDALQPSTISVDGIEGDEAAPSPAKKRKLSTPAASPSTTLGASSRLRVLAVFVSYVPSSALPALLDALKAFSDDLVEPRLKDFFKASTAANGAVEGGDADLGTPSKKDKKKRRKSSLLPSAINGGGSDGEVEPAVRLGVELLEVRYAALERLSREGLLEAKEGEADEKWWVLKGKRREGLREVVEKGVGEATIVATRTLLQHLQLDGAGGEEAQAVFKTVFDRVTVGTDESRWSSFVRDVEEREVPVALWELVSRRWLSLAENLAADAQLQQVVDIVLGALARPALRDELSISGATCRLLLRADFWELSRIQALFQPSLVALVTLPSLSSPSPLIAGELDAKTLTALRSLSTSTLTSTARLFPTIVATVPLEYLSKATRELLAERALALDVWIGSSEVEVDGQEKESLQRQLRSFMTLLALNSTLLPPLMPAIFKSTLPGAKEATLELFRSVIQTALANLKADQSPAVLIKLVQNFGEKPLGDLSKRSKKGGDLGVTTAESAFLLLLETLATSLPNLDGVPAPLLEALDGSAKNAFKSLDKVLPLATAALKDDKEAFFRLSDFLDASRSSWIARAWLSKGSTEVEPLAAFVECARAASFAHLPSLAEASAVSPALALLRLLAYRIERLDRSTEASEVASEPFEEFVACHLAFRRVLLEQARDALNDNLVRCVSVVSLSEYGAVLDGLAIAVGAASSLEPVPSTLQELDQALDVALVLLRDGPEGSSRTASSALSEIIRHLSLLVERVLEQPVQGELSVAAYSVAARFLEGICGERPMLLSRLNISNVLSLVSRLLQPSTALPAPSRPSAPAVGELYRTLVTVVTHLVRHRKDHIIPLFPLLVSALSGFVAILRRAGYGTTGSALSIDEPTDSSVVFGQRVEREAKATFPAWIWEGGSRAVGRAEAKTFSRLLGELSAKTAAPATKRKKDSTGAAGEGSSTTTSLIAPLSKHAPFLLLTYLRASVHVTCPIPLALRTELQGGWFEVMDSMGRWEREALMKGFLGEEEEAERGMLRTLFKTWEKERYRG
ncbi:hypothetical protein JCM6882_001761 [Rhodosporidiobolus microsporus]